MYGYLMLEQAIALRPWVEGRVVHDLGAADLSLSRELLALGAFSIVAVDKERMPRQKTKNIRLLTCSFLEVLGPVETAFLSWPINGDGGVGLLRLVQQADTVIYLGKNTDGVSCGSPELFAHLASRELLAYVPTRRNTLLVVGPRRVVRLPRGEEVGGLFTEKIFAYEELEPVSSLWQSREF